MLSEEGWAGAERGDGADAERGGMGDAERASGGMGAWMLSEVGMGGC